MVHLMEIDNEDDSIERVNLDDYDSDDFREYLSDDNMQTTTTMVEVTTNFIYEPSHPPPSVTVTVKMEEEGNDLEKERRRILN